MVTSAVWSDINNDQRPDLLVTYQWASIGVYINDNGKLFKTILQLQGSVSSGDGGMVFVLVTLTMMVTWILSSQTMDQIPNTNLKE